MEVFPEQSRAAECRRASEGPGEVDRPGECTRTADRDCGLGSVKVARVAWHCAHSGQKSGTYAITWRYLVDENGRSRGGGRAHSYGEEVR